MHLTIILFLICFFLLGMFVYSFNYYHYYQEGMTNQTNQSSIVSTERCPNMLIQKGTNYFLYNSKLAKVPGVNPIQFNNLEEYTEFIEWQRSQGIHCPILFLQHNYDIQGNASYNIRPGPHDLQGGVPTNALPPVNPNPTLLTDASHDDPPYNYNSIPGYDGSSQYVGATTPLDLMQPNQADPMSDTWAGGAYSQELIDKGYYQGNEVAIKVA